jgi:hypothetical protein
MTEYSEPIVLFRKSLAEEGEFEVCRKYFKVITQRTELHPINTPFFHLVIPRYSALPYYDELERDIDNLGGVLINSLKQHNYIANFEWYDDLKDFTPRTWFDDDIYRADCDGPFVVKGRTNSKKFHWDRLMYADTKYRAVHVAGELMNDNLIGTQGIIYREYVPLKTYEVGLNGLPFSNEWRFFFYKEEMLSCGYYWSVAEKTDYIVEPDCIEFAKNVAKIVASKVNFFVLDVAERKSGGWVLIEINDGSQSGLSENSADTLYSNLKRVLEV